MSSWFPCVFEAYDWIIKETKTELDVERQNPKIKKSGKDYSERRTTLLIENYLRGPPLALELDDFLRNVPGASRDVYGRGHV